LMLSQLAERQQQSSSTQQLPTLPETVSVEIQVDPAPMSLLAIAETASLAEAPSLSSFLAFADPTPTDPMPDVPPAVQQPTPAAPMPYVPPAVQKPTPAAPMPYVPPAVQQVTPAAPMPDVPPAIQQPPVVQYEHTPGATSSRATTVH
jgi:hypothetical protein